MEFIEEFKKDWDEFKKTNSQIMAKKAEGKSVSDLEEKLGKLSAKIDEHETTAKRMADLETAVKRMGQFARTDGVDPAETIFRKAFRVWAAKGAANSTFADSASEVLAKDAELKSRYFEAHPELKALSVGDDTQGGFFVHADLSGRIVKRIFETSPIRKYASVTSISTDALEGIVDADEASFGWVGETGARGQTANPVLGAWRIPTHEMWAMPATTQKLLDDAQWDPEAWLAAKVSDKFARAENYAFVLGDGVTKPRGFLTVNTILETGSYDSFLKDKKVGFVKTGVNDAFPAVPTTVAPTAQANPIIDLMYSLKTYYREQAGTAFAAHRLTFGAMRKLQDAFGNYLWQPGFNGQPSSFFGFPVLEFNDMPKIGDTSKFAIAFGNWREAYQIVDRIGIRILRDPFTAKPYVLFYTTKRTGGDILNYEALKFLSFSA